VGRCCLKNSDGCRAPGGSRSSPVRSWCISPTAKSLPATTAKANAYSPQPARSRRARLQSLAFPVHVPLAAQRREGGRSSSVQRLAGAARGQRTTYAELFGSGRLRFAGYAPTWCRRCARVQQRRAAVRQYLRPGRGLAALPAALAGSAFLDMDVRNDHPTSGGCEVHGALLVAASVAIVYLIAAPFTTRARAALAGGAYAVGTCAWSISSQTLWQQTAALFFLSLGTLCIVRGNTAWIRGAAAGLAFSAAMALRPTGVVVLAAAAPILLSRTAVRSTRSSSRRCRWRRARRLQLPLLRIAARVRADGDGRTSRPAQDRLARSLADARLAGASGLLLSPSRGLLVHRRSSRPRSRGRHRLEAAALRRAALRSGRLLLLWIPAFLWFDWWGGWTYGYRADRRHDAFARRAVCAALDRVLERRAWTHRVHRRPRVVGAGADRRRLRLYAAGMECAGPWSRASTPMSMRRNTGIAVVVPRLADRIFHAPLSAVLRREPRLRRGMGG